jgi:hypothetical protein
MVLNSTYNHMLHSTVPKVTSLAQPAEGVLLQQLLCMSAIRIQRHASIG